MKKATRCKPRSLRASEFETFKNQWTAYNDLQEKVAKIIDFDKDAKEHRDGRQKQIAESMLAAYRVYAQGEPLAAVAADTKLDPQQLSGWVQYLKTSKAPELARWRAATNANRNAAADQYQEEFRQSAYQYDQDLSWWQGAQRGYPKAGKMAGPRPQMRPGQRRVRHRGLAKQRSSPSLS